MIRPRYQPRNVVPPEQEVLPLETVCTVLVRQSKSTQRETNLFSAEANPKDLVAEAMRLGFPTERIHLLDWDMGIGAYNTTIEERPALLHWLTELLPSGESRVVLVSQEDRLFRDRTEIQVNRFIETVTHYGGWVICGLAGRRVYNFRREMDKEQFRLACKYGKQYIDFHLKQRLHPAIQRAAMVGRYVGGGASWGYVVDYNARSATYKHFVRYEPHAELVLDHVFRHFATLLRPSVTDVARHWEALGLVWPFFTSDVDPRGLKWVDTHFARDETQGGYRFHRKQAQHILTDVAYLGWSVRKGEIARDAAAQEPLVCHPPLVEADLFWWCYDRLSAERPDWAPLKATTVTLIARPRRLYGPQSGEIRSLGHGRIRCLIHNRPFAVVQTAAQGIQLRCNGADQRLYQGPAGCPIVSAERVDTALVEGFAEQLTLDEGDLHELARLAEQRARSRDGVVVRLHKEINERRAHAKRALQLALRAGDVRLQDELLAEAREANHLADVREAELAVAQVEAGPLSSKSWWLAQRAATVAEAIRATFGSWTPAAQARVLALALREAALGRVDRYTLSLQMHWHGGRQSYRTLVSRYGQLLTWSPEETQVLRAGCATLTWEALCRSLPGRTVEAIKTHASRIGLERPRSGQFSSVVEVVASPPVAPNSLAGSMESPVLVTSRVGVGMPNCQGSTGPSTRPTIFYDHV